MKSFVTLIIAILFHISASASPDTSTHARTALDIYRHIIEIDSSSESGGAPRVAAYLASQLIAAGFPTKDIEVIPLEDTAALVTTYRGDGSSDKGPILLLGHMDVIGANPDEWDRPPFELTRDDTHFHGRGTSDNKFGIAQLTATFIRLKAEDFQPNRDLLLVFMGDEETEGKTAHYLATQREDIAGAEFALNSDAGGGVLDSEGKALVYRIQVAEKTYATWEITVRNPGGHSASPRSDNAIYDLADAVQKLRKHRFPVRWNDMTLAYFRETGKQLGGELGDVMSHFADNPQDHEAADRLFAEPSYVGSTRTTCIPTMLRAGQAENALPESATITINCRIFPGISADEVKAVLQEVVGGEPFEFRHIGTPIIESPASPLRPDILAAIRKAAHAQHPGIPLIPYMSSGATDGMYFRNAGIPTWAVGGSFKKPGESHAHGLNEQMPIKAFYGALDHWSIILRELASGQ